MLQLTTARPLHPLARLAAVLAVGAALVVLQQALLRPWYARWGATEAEAKAALPGDEQWPDPRWQETRALTIAAPPAAVWPWVAQLGQDKGGFYSYALLENLVGARMRNADRLVGAPEPRPGDRLWMAPPDAFGGMGYGVLGRVDPGHVLVMIGHEGADPAPAGTWAFVLEPQGEGTRLLVRGRAGRTGQAGGAGLAAWLSRSLRVVAFEPVHFVMERRMLLGIAERAEGRPPATLALTLEPIAWLVVLGVVLAALVAALARARPGRALRLLAAAGVALLVLPLTEPPLVATVGAAALLAAALPWALGRGSQPRRLA